ncbi:MAG: FtsX-like permease family protein, partial [Gemmatimonadetes bacterium]|nr:FtsX-like permease family protein [Gemmatimonadota bacterium]
IYGVIAYLVIMRTNEIGIRMALGAKPGSVFRSVVGQGLALALLALPLGIGGALVVNRSLSSILYQVSPGDPMTLASISALVVVVALLACWLPARRAMRVDPMTALRWE